MRQFDNSRLIGQSVAFRRLVGDAEQVAPLDVSVLLTGATGTGKSTLAEFIHSMSSRAQSAFCELNCAAVPTELIESELFGVERGAYTDAKERRAGLFEQADGGTLLLDEIGEMSADLQAKLLRVVETKQVRRLGGQRALKCDVRLIYATHRDIQATVRAGAFREDLYYRIDEARIHVPALNERREDIPVLVERYLAAAREKLGRAEPFRLDEAALNVLCNHSWPGNIRELGNVVFKIALATVSAAMITAPDVGSVLRRRASDNPPPPAVLAVEDAVVESPGELLRSIPLSYVPGEESIDVYFARVLIAVYESLLAQGKRHAEASRLLGIGRTTLYERLELARAIVARASHLKSASC